MIEERRTWTPDDFVCYSYQLQVESDLLLSNKGIRSGEAASFLMHIDHVTSLELDVAIS